MAFVGLGACAAQDDADLPATSNDDVTSTATLHFAGHDWYVKSGSDLGPGHNAWDPSLAFVDAEGALHLRIAPRADGRWACAEITSRDLFGPGSYRFDVIGRLDQLPANAVLGLFNYASPQFTTDGTRELDIEFSQWGNPNNANRINYTIWDSPSGSPLATRAFPIQQSGTFTWHEFTWSAESVQFASFHGHGDERYPIARQTLTAHGTTPRPIHMNFWLTNATPPADGQPLEVVISRFDYAP